MAGRMVKPGQILVAGVFLLVLASQWAASDAGRLMGAPKTHQSSTKSPMPRLVKERKLAYDYSHNSDASWDAYDFSSDTSFMTQDVETNDVEDTYIDSPETVHSSDVESSLAADPYNAFSPRDPNADDVYFDTSSADTVYSAAESDL